MGDYFFWGHYDSVDFDGTQFWARKYIERYIELNKIENLTIQEKQELDILATGTESEYQEFLKQ